MKYNWYIVKNGEIVAKCMTEEEVAEIMEQDQTGELEAYPREALIEPGTNPNEELIEISLKIEGR